MKIVRSLLFTGILSCLLLPGVRAFAFTAYIGEVAPFTLVDDDGKVTGAAVEVVQAVMETAGYPFDTDDIKVISWARAVEDTETIPGSMLFCMARTPQREDRFKWVGPIAEVNLGLVAKVAPRVTIEASEDMREYRIGAIRNSAPVDILEKEYGIPASEMTLLANDILQFRMLDNGRVDVITQADTAAPTWLEQLEMDQSEFEMVHVLKELQLYIAFNKRTDDHTIQRIQAALEALKRPENGEISRYDAIMKKYLRRGAIPKQAK